MNIDEMIIRAVAILNDVGIVKKDKNDESKKYIVKTFRGQISSFGAAVMMGDLTSAVAFYSAKGGSITDRFRLMNAIYLLLLPEDNVDEIQYVKSNPKEPHLLKHVLANNNDSGLKKEVIDASVAIKLAMNVYELRKDDKDGGQNDIEES